MELEEFVPVTDERKRLRFTCTATITVTTDDGRIVKGKMRDIGIDSLYLYTDKDSDEFLIYGEPVQTQIKMRRGHSDLTIELEGNVARMDEMGFVVKFRHLLKWWPIFTMFPVSKFTEK